MKGTRLPFAVALALTALRAFSVEPASSPSAEPPPELRGVLIVGTSQRFALSAPGGARAIWTTIGESFEGWRLTDYRPSDGTLVVAKGSREVSIQPVTSTIQAVEVKATVADAEALLRKMGFDAMIAKTFETQKLAVVKMMRQMLAQRGVAGVAVDDMARFQEKIFDQIFGSIDGGQLRGDIARIYSEVFTKDELLGLSDFYGTQAGLALVAKQPLLQEKMMETMTPRIMAAMPKIQQMSMEFAQEQAAKRKATLPATATPPGN